MGDRMSEGLEANRSLNSCREQRPMWCVMGKLQMLYLDLGCGEWFDK
jgi:hypothetical protein